MQHPKNSGKGKVVLPAPLLTRANLDEGYGLAGYRGPMVSLKKMREGVERKAKSFKIER